MHGEGGKEKKTWRKIRSVVVVAVVGSG